jgi:hypothetical protein
VEQAALGRFINSGNSLTWLGTQNTTIQAGQRAYVVPSIKYPAGSGFSVPFAEVEAVWVNGVPLDSGNIRYGEEDGARGDLTAYQAPAVGQNYFAVFGRERAALHYIYEKTVVTADASGAITIPTNAGGCFAFVEGFPAGGGAINKPVVTGLTPNTTYNTLTYYTPALTQPVQVQFRYTPYQGIGVSDPEWLNDATVASSPLCYITCHGGGNSVFRGDARIRYSPIAMHLPQINSASTPPYTLDTPMQLFGEPYNGPMTFRQIVPLPGNGLSLPSPGMRLSFQPGTIGLGSGLSLNGKLLGDGSLIGCRSPLLEGRKPFLIVVGFMAHKNGEDRLVIMSRATTGSQDIPCDASQQTGFDVFRV